MKSKLLVLLSNLLIPVFALAGKGNEGPGGGNEGPGGGTISVVHLDLARELSIEAFEASECAQFFKTEECQKMLSKLMANEGHYIFESPLVATIRGELQEVTMSTGFDTVSGIKVDLERLGRIDISLEDLILLVGHEATRGLGLQDAEQESENDRKIRLFFEKAIFPTLSSRISIINELEDRTPINAWNVRVRYALENNVPVKVLFEKDFNNTKIGYVHLEDAKRICADVHAFYKDKYFDVVCEYYGKHWEEWHTRWVEDWGSELVGYSESSYFDPVSGEELYSKEPIFMDTVSYRPEEYRERYLSFGLRIFGVAPTDSIQTVIFDSSDTNESYLAEMLGEISYDSTKTALIACLNQIKELTTNHIEKHILRSPTCRPYRMNESSYGFEIISINPYISK
ncbi:MAG: hypothetical protein AB8E15_01760 [Bdellovibrionales bacterium]